MKRPPGHWFCNNCDDVVFMSYQRTDARAVCCPDCGRIACEWVPDKITRKQLGEVWFGKMRETVAAAETPELPTQTGICKPDFGKRLLL